MHQFADFFGIGTPELLIIVVIILLLFGGTQLPKLFRNAGSSMREFQKGMNGQPDAQKPTQNAPQKPTQNENENKDRNPPTGTPAQ